MSPIGSRIKWRYRLHGHVQDIMCWLYRAKEHGCAAFFRRHRNGEDRIRIKPPLSSVSSGVPLSGRLLAWDAAQLAHARRQVQRRDDGALLSWRELQAEADRALAVDPPTVMNKRQTPPSGDKHDYLSFGRYWWPDPKRRDGLPYIRRDGEVNPESCGPHSDWRALETMSDAVEKLSLAYYFSNDERYAEKAAQLLRRWFLDRSTRMRPRLEFGQAVPGIAEGRGVGIIEARRFLRVIESVGLLVPSGHWLDEDEQGLRAWFGEFLHWTLTSRLGREQDAARNNLGTWYDALVVGLAFCTGQEDLARKRLMRAPARRIDAQIRADGSQPRELARTDSFHYCTFNLEGLVLLATYGKRLGVDLWEYRGRQGSSIEQALRWHARFADLETKWEHEPSTDFNRIGDLEPVLAQVAVVFDSDMAATALHRLTRDQDSPSILRLLWPSAWERGSPQNS